MSHPSTFRPLNDAERALIAALVKRGKLPEDDYRTCTYYNVLRVSYENMQGGFCVCLLLIDTSLDAQCGFQIDNNGSDCSRLLYRGASRRSYKDSRNQLRGEMMAFRRAVLYSHPINLDALGGISE